MQIAQIMPTVVLAELRDDGETVMTGAAEMIRQQTNEIWKDQASVTTRDVTAPAREARTVALVSNLQRPGRPPGRFVARGEPKGSLV